MTVNFGSIQNFSTNGATGAGRPPPLSEDQKKQFMNELQTVLNSSNPAQAMTEMAQKDPDFLEKLKGLGGKLLTAEGRNEVSQHLGPDDMQKLTQVLQSAFPGGGQMSDQYG